MWTLLSAVFIASFCGSLHCVGMCGPLAVLAASRADGRSPRLSSVFAYHGSRTLAYSIAGLIVGLFGAGLQQTGSWLGAQRLAAQLAGGSMLVIGLLSLVRLMSGTPHALFLPKALQRKLAAGHAWARAQRPLVKASAVGFLTAVLPCGWLYAFLIVAAGTADPISGAAVMTVFSLGALPALSVTAIGTSWIAERFRPAIPWASALLVTAIGMVTLVSRSQIDLSGMQPISVATEPASLVSHVEKINAEPLPCCEATGAPVCNCNKKKP